MKTRVYLKYFVSDYLWKEFLTFSSPQTSSNLISFPVFVTLRSFHLKFEQLSCKKLLKFSFLTNCFLDLFTEVKAWYCKTFKVVLQSFLEVNSSPNMPAF